MIQQVGLHRSASACDPSLAGITFHGFLYIQPQDPLMDVRSCSWTLHCTSSCSNQHLPSLAIPITCGSHVHYILGSCRHRNLLLLVSTFRLGFNIHSLTNYSMGSLLAAVSTLLLPSQGKARDKPDRD